jgi:hypothetical protein
MKYVVLYFPTSFDLARFILDEQVAGVETFAVDASLKGTLTDEQIVTACTKYKGIIRSMKGEL